MLLCDSGKMVSVCQWHNGKCVYVSGCVWHCVCVSVSFLFLPFKLILGCLFIPHLVNQGGVQMVTPQVTLYESHTSEESLRRREVVDTVRYCLTIRTNRGNSCTWCFQHIRGSVSDTVNGAPTVLSCRYLVRSPHCRHRHPLIFTLIFFLLHRRVVWTRLGKRFVVDPSFFCWQMSEWNRSYLSVCVSCVLCVCFVLSMTFVYFFMNNW